MLNCLFLIVLNIFKISPNMKLTGDSIAYICIYELCKSKNGKKLTGLHPHISEAVQIS